MADQKQITSLANDRGELMDALEVSRGEKTLDTFAQLVSAYSEPHRHYHNLDHISWMLFVISDVAYVDPFLLTANIRLATWYHDVVYDPRRSDNEARSALVAESSLADLGIASNIVNRVRDLILMTKEHIEPMNDAEASLFIDVDLGVLGADPTIYAEYAAAIRKEYDWVADRQFFEGRRNVLQRFQARRRIIRNDWYDCYSESQARTNIAAEIAQIDEILLTLPS